MKDLKKKKINKRKLCRDPQLGFWWLSSGLFVWYVCVAAPQWLGKGKNRTQLRIGEYVGRWLARSYCLRGEN